MVMVTTYIIILLCCSVTESCPTLCDPMDCNVPVLLSLTISQRLHKLMSNKSVMLSNNLILCHSLLILPSTFPSIRIFSKQLAVCTRWPNYWRFSISPFNEYSGLFSFKINSFDLLAVQGTLRVFSSATVQKH